MPEPLLGYKSYPILLELEKAKVYQKDKKKALWVLYKLISQLRQERRNLLSVLLFLLYCIDLTNDFMKAENLATVVTPSLSRKEVPSLDDVDDAKLINNMGTILILHYKELFKDDKELIQGIFSEHFNQDHLKFEGDQEITDYLFSKSFQLISDTPKVFIQTNLKRSESLLSQKKIETLEISPRNNRSDSLSTVPEVTKTFMFQDLIDLLTPKSSKKGDKDEDFIIK